MKPFFTLSAPVTDDGPFDANTINFKDEEEHSFFLALAHTLSHTHKTMITTTTITITILTRKTAYVHKFGWRLFEWQTMYGRKVHTHTRSPNK